MMEKFNLGTVTPETSDWKCYMFGSKVGSGYSFLYQPSIGNIPNWFIRYMMKICLGCTWVKEKE